MCIEIVHPGLVSSAHHLRSIATCASCHWLACNTCDLIASSLAGRELLPSIYLLSATAQMAHLEECLAISLIQVPDSLPVTVSHRKDDDPCDIL